MHLLIEYYGLILKKVVFVYIIVAHGTIKYKIISSLQL